MRVAHYRGVVNEIRILNFVKGDLFKIHVLVNCDFAAVSPILFFNRELSALNSGPVYTLSVDHLVIDYSHWLL